MMGGALLREFGVRVRPRSVTCVHKCDWHLEWNTPGSPGRYAGKSNGLLSKYHRYHSLHIFRNRIRNQIENQVENRKSRMDRIENLSAKKRKKSTYLVPRVVFRLGLIDVVQRLHKLRTYLLTETTLPRIFNLICFLRYSRPRETALCKLCTNIDQPYLIWAAVLCDISMLHQKTNDTGTKNPTEKKRRGCMSVMTFWDLELLQRCIPAGQLYIF